MTMQLLPENSSSFSVRALAQAQIKTLQACAVVMQTRRHASPYIFSHTTALLLLAIELPRLMKFPLERVHVCVTHQQNSFHCKGVTFHLWKHEFSPVSFGGEIFCVPPVVAWAQVARYVTLEELVVLGDSMMRRDVHLKRATMHEFEDFLERTTYFSGRRNCLKALTYMTENTDSSQESRLMLLLLQAGLPRPFSNYRVIDPETGQNFLLDFAYAAQKIDIEYNGHYHDSDSQIVADVKRQNRLLELGWTIFTVKAEHLHSGQQQTDFLSALLNQLID